MKKCYKKGDILLVNFPYTNMVDFKVRPALVLRDQDSEDIIVLGISSQMELRKQDVLIKEDFYQGKPLILPSAIRIGKIATIHSDLAVKKVSALKADFFKQVQKSLAEYLLR